MYICSSHLNFFFFKFKWAYFKSKHSVSICICLTPVKFFLRLTSFQKCFYQYFNKWKSSNLPFSEFFQPSSGYYDPSNQYAANSGSRNDGSSNLSSQIGNNTSATTASGNCHQNCLFRLAVIHDPGQKSRREG